MTHAEASRRTAPSAWSSTAFFAAGLFFVVFATFWIVQTFTGASAPEARGPFGATGWLAAFLGLVGVYPGVVERAEGWARAGLALVAVGSVGAATMAVSGFGSLLGLWGQGPAWLGFMNFVIMVGIIPGFLSFGIAAWRSATVPRSVATLLFMPAVIFLINLTSIAILSSVGSGPVAWGAMVLASAQTIVLLAIAVLLRRVNEGRAHAGLASE